MVLTHEYLQHRRGYAFGAGWCWIRIYEGGEGDAPVVVCQELAEAGSISEMAAQLAAEVIVDHFGGGLPDLVRPLLWIEHRPARRRGPGRFALLTFPSYEPRLAGAGFVRRVTLGAPRREPLTPAEVEALIGEP